SDSDSDSGLDNSSDKNTKDKLPDTGANEDHDSKGTLLGALFAGLGALLLGKRRKNRKNKN
ncbi:MAG: LPXTG cell wall anchor domain-containing protein, partial [Staphylococcus epidermidis]|nr:LPXTG cell wall anchor domain-containing protein [Staphylococcus epidermidis]MDU2221764.1 LPXTG cell wall anchor domain-containing protein [Staphylococcus epidermidis]MDU2272099.1 LPXTG cell wall anchor domain-containing protein [Staphylococcus epidermidis]MDU3083833.1 LPXTG cell wall anchor domain-containing protein [Staphylococcus epidermidis]MDU3952229.1 LPXTG cell wall anchor domain-containing protein [Staphylococcus epidermidis]